MKPRRFKTLLKKMWSNWVLVISLLLAFFILLIYIIHFGGAPLSNSTTDWGAFGDYVGIVLGILSIFLIYLTYREQSFSNKIARFEQHFVTMVNTLSELTEKEKEDLESCYEAFCNHFMVPFADLAECTNEKTKKVCFYYYSNITTNEGYNFDYLFRYFSQCLEYVEREETLNCNEKKGRITEFICIVPESLRILFLCWCISQDGESIQKYYHYGVFKQDRDNSFLAVIISYICTGIISPLKDSEEEKLGNIEYGDNSEEQFQDTYNKLFNKEKLI